MPHLIGGSTRRIPVTTGEKLSSTSTFRFGTAADVTDLVTTQDVPDELLRRYEDEGVTLHLVEVDPEPREG